MRNYILFFFFYSFTAIAQIGPDKYFPKKLVYSLNIDSCTILKSGRDGKLKYDIKVVYDRAKMRMYFDDYYTGMRMEFLYNKDTQLIVQNLTSKKPKALISQDSIFYNKNGQKQRYKSINFKDKKSKPIATVYEYRNDTLIKEVYTYGSEVFRTIYYTYNQNNRTKQQTTINVQSNTENIIYNYNVINQLISYTALTATNDTLYTYRYIYDASGRVIETRVLDKFGNLQNLYKTSYLSNGLIDYEEEYLVVKENRLETAIYQKKKYKYAFKKPKK